MLIQVVAKLAQVGFSMVQVGPKLVQVGCNLAQAGPKLAQIDPKLDPSWHQVGTKVAASCSQSTLRLHEGRHFKNSEETNATQ